MLKLILKNLWARRRRNGWLLAELILVSIVTWIILDPVIVMTYDVVFLWVMILTAFVLLLSAPCSHKLPVMMKRLRIRP